VYLGTNDDPERDVLFTPSGKYDARSMLTGHRSLLDSDDWVSGFFDRDSFMETLGGWGKTVITGRARLGGIPIGVIAVETQTVERVVPADPADSRSQEEVLAQAAQVWYPDSAYKTAQAIADFNHGEELPLIIFANWRGFSGGMRDMFNEILKFGSLIVDNLRKYKQPVFIYLPPHAELRGGAWVVLDSTINPDMMEMYADETSRGGVLEPAGAVEIKFRDRDLLKTMHRLDQKLVELDAALSQSLKDAQGKDAPQIKKKIAAREKELLPAYQMMSLKFADLHDTPGRMKEKEVIHGVVSWKNSRRFFYHRLRRRLAEERLCKLIAQVKPEVSHAAALELISEWLSTTHDAKQGAGLFAGLFAGLANGVNGLLHGENGAGLANGVKNGIDHAKHSVSEDDARVARTLEDAMREGGWAQDRLRELRAEWMAAEMMKMSGEDSAAFRRALAMLHESKSNQ